MNPHFDDFARYVDQKLGYLGVTELFVIDVEPDNLNKLYLESFPRGTNEVFRKRPEHDCACCRNFIKNFGGVFAIRDGQRETLWADHASLPEPYSTVARSMHEYVMQQPVRGVFRTKERQFGGKPNWDKQDSNIRWNHLYGQVADRHRDDAPDAVRGVKATTAQVFKRGLDELTPAALTTVIDLIESDSLYRGTEHLRAVKEFARLQELYLAAAQPELYVLENMDSPVARFRNTVIGTLVDAISSGTDVDSAVRMFESKVAPQNYRRTTAPITPRMVEAAERTLQELGLESAIMRRFANASDLYVNDVLFVDNAVQAEMRDGLRGLLHDAIKPQRVGLTSAVEMDIDSFMLNVLPNTRRLEVLVKSQHGNRFVSLTAPAAAGSRGRLFKWQNDFAWSYYGGYADSVKERVKRAGGNVDAKLRVSLAWSNKDDLDLHCVCPDGHIYFGNKARILDVDMNARVEMLVSDPVENLSWVNPRDGAYKVMVHQFNKRENQNTGFSMQIECGSMKLDLQHANAVMQGQEVQCFEFKMKNGKIEDLRVNGKALTGETKSTKIWGVDTETFVPVTMVMHSPNFWEGAGGIGNKHWFFMLKDCINPDAERGFYNEYLNNALTPHSRVFEVLANKIKCPPTPNQLSGLGFSSTQRASLTVKASNALGSRAYTINF